MTDVLDTHTDGGIRLPLDLVESAIVSALIIEGRHRLADKGHDVARIDQILDSIEFTLELAGFDKAVALLRDKRASFKRIPDEPYEDLGAALLRILKPEGVSSPVVTVDPEGFRQHYDIQSGVPGYESNSGLEPEEEAVITGATDDQITEALEHGFSGDFWWNIFDECMGQARDQLSIIVDRDKEAT